MPSHQIIRIYSDGMEFQAISFFHFISASALFACHNLFQQMCSMLLDFDGGASELVGFAIKARWVEGPALSSQKRYLMRLIFDYYYNSASSSMADY